MSAAQCEENTLRPCAAIKQTSSSPFKATRCCSSYSCSMILIRYRSVWRHPAISAGTYARGMAPISDEAHARDGIDIRPDAMYPISIADPSAPGDCRSAGCLPGTDIDHRSGGHTGLHDIDGHMATRDIDCRLATVVGTHTDHGGQVPDRFDSGCFSGPCIGRYRGDVIDRRYWSPQWGV